MHTSIVILGIHFNDINWRPCIPRLSKEWITARMEIFMNYTCKSLMAQTDSDFYAFIYYDPLSEKEIFEALSDYPKLPDHIRFLPSTHENKDYTQLIKDSEYFYYSRLDSDNMYASTYVDFIKNYPAKEDTQFIALSSGYGYNARTGEMAPYCANVEYLYTYVYHTDAYLNGIRHREIPLGTKESATRIPHEVITTPSLYMLTWHGSNVTNSSGFLVHPKKIIHDSKEVSHIWYTFTGEYEPYILKIPEVTYQK